jgi:CHAT domain-containing protein
MDMKGLNSPVRDRDSGSHGPQRVRILFLGANSLNSPLELDKEVRRIQISLRLGKERDNLELKQEWAVTVDTLMQAMLDESPTIVHFSGHGKESGIVLQDEIDEPKVISTDALLDLFKLFKDTVRCVVLSSCYSETQARAIRRYIPYVIGIRSGIPDSAAVAFSAGFYKALGAGKDIPFAFELGKTSIRLEGFLDENLLVLV